MPAGSAAIVSSRGRPKWARTESAVCSRIGGRLHHHDPVMVLEEWDDLAEAVGRAEQAGDQHHGAPVPTTVTCSDSAGATAIRRRSTESVTNQRRGSHHRGASA
jgi:hypothetical protein